MGEAEPEAESEAESQSEAPLSRNPSATVITSSP